MATRIWICGFKDYFDHSYRGQTTETPATVTMKTTKSRKVLFLNLAAYTNDEARLLVYCFLSDPTEYKSIVRGYNRHELGRIKKIITSTRQFLDDYIVRYEPTEDLLIVDTTFMQMTATNNILGASHWTANVAVPTNLLLFRDGVNQDGLLDLQTAFPSIFHNFDRCNALYEKLRLHYSSAF